jgi:hypothetical protein
VLGETVHPQDFNTLRRIREEDGTVIEEEEQFTELASSEFLIQQLRNLLDSGGREALETLPDGIHSGMARAGARGIFFYFQAVTEARGKLHFWRFYDLRDQRIIENRYLIANLIACDKDTPRVVDPDVIESVFDIQDKVIEDIIGSVERQRALESAPRSVDPVQQTIATIVQGYLSHPDVNRQRAIEIIRALNQPMLAVHVRELRKAYDSFQRSSDIEKLLQALELSLKDQFSSQNGLNDLPAHSTLLKRDDLRLICFEIISAA